MRTLTLRVYPYPDVHTEDGDGPRISDIRLGLIRNGLPKLFEIGPEGDEESFRATVDFRPGRLVGASAQLGKADVQRQIEELIEQERAEDDLGGPWTARVLISQQLACDKELATYGALFDLGDGEGPARR